MPTPFLVEGLGEKLVLTEDTRLAAQEMLELGMTQVRSTAGANVVKTQRWNSKTNAQARLDL